MRFFITGDLHGIINLSRLDLVNVITSDSITKEDYVVILGDFGIPFSTKGTSRYKIEIEELKRLSDRPWTTLFIDGNHENFDNLFSYPVIDYHNGKATQIEEHIFHLRRGEIYTFGNKKIFTFGGADSIDKSRRILGQSWWKEELPSHKEIEYSLDKLENSNYSVDYVFTHTAPRSILSKYLYHDIIYEDPTCSYFDFILERLKFDKWLFGHHHIDKELDSRFCCLYNKWIFLNF